MTRTEIMTMLAEVYRLKLKIINGIEEMREESKSYSNMCDLALCERDMVEMFSDMADDYKRTHDMVDVMRECDALPEFLKMTDAERRAWVYKHMPQ